MMDLSRFSWRFLQVWRRNLILYRRIWKVNFLVPLLEPLFYIAAFGIGFRYLVGPVKYGGATLSYTQFIAPALIATAVMSTAFFETSYASFVRMYYQKTFDGMLATPLSLEEIILAEIVWSASKAVGAAVIMVAVLGALGFITFPLGFLIVILALLGGLAFGAIGMFFTGIVASIDMFNLPVFLFITPMFLFSGTFFPVSALPHWGQTVSLVFPLYHLVALTRDCAMGVTEGSPALNIAYLLVFFVVFTGLSLSFMRRRLIR